VSEESKCSRDIGICWTGDDDHQQILLSRWDHVIVCFAPSAKPFIENPVDINLYHTTTLMTLKASLSRSMIFMIYTLPHALNEERL
jgi:hypothetical protein